MSVAPPTTTRDDIADEAPGGVLKIVPRHMAIIMDGNGRWARSRFMPRVQGHRQGAKTVRMVVEEARRLGIRYLTLFAFSTENWKRPQDEVGGLMQLFVQHLESELDILLKNGVRLRAMGNVAQLPQSVQELLARNEKKTEHLSGMDLILAVSYGGRDELVQAVRRIAEGIESGVIKSGDVTEDLIQRSLYLPDVPDPDLLIRTSGETRISNFLLWQLAYSEIVVSSQFWPEFSRDELYRCLHVFAGRNRRFGLTQEQLAGS
jgi:undecaprenyl diphosphate synthase